MGKEVVNTYEKESMEVTGLSLGEVRRLRSIDFDTAIRRYLPERVHAILEERKIYFLNLEKEVITERVSENGVRSRPAPKSWRNALTSSQPYETNRLREFFEYSANQEGVYWFICNSRPQELLSQELSEIRNRAIIAEGKRRHKEIQTLRGLRTHRYVG